MGLRNNRILLIQPPADVDTKALDVVPYPPMGLAYIAAVLQKKGYEVCILDAFVEGWEDVKRKNKKGVSKVGLEESEIAGRISRYDPAIAGISSEFSVQRRNAHKVGKICKEVNRDIITVFGGAHATVLPEDVLAGADADFVVMGEGEETFPELVDRLKDNRNIPGMGGIAYSSPSGPVIESRKGFVEELDRLPFPAVDLLPLQKYFDAMVTHGGALKNNRYMPIITSRGCPAGCIFCSAHKVWGKRYRPRSPENVMEELLGYKNRLGIEEVVFEDDNLTFDIPRAKKLFRLMIDSGLDLSWDTPNGVAAWSLDEETIDLMKKSGCRRINFAVESGDQHILDNVVKKPLKLSKVEKLIGYSKKIGLEVGVFLVVGLPGEREDNIKKSFAFARKVGVYTPFISIATPYPGTELYDICSRYGYFSCNFNLDSLTISRYNIETKNLSIASLRRIVSNERIKMRIFYYLNNPDQIPMFFKRRMLGQ
jgi:anaerobic magnesium-protoporphyrin IX monomethyl ester cyclase